MLKVSLEKSVKKVLVLGVMLFALFLATSNVSAATSSETLDFEKTAEENGFDTQKTDLRKFIEERAKKQGMNYTKAAKDVFESVKKVHEKYSNKPLYNDLINSSSKADNKEYSRNIVNSVALSTVVNAYALSTSDYLVTNTEEIVSGDLSIQYGVDTLLYSEGSFREFVEVYEDTAFVLPYGTGSHDWNPAYERATKTSASKISFRAYGNLESVVSTSVSAGFELAGFSVSSQVGTTVTLRKTHQIAHVFSLY